MDIEKRISTELGISEKQIIAVVKMVQEGATIPFMARYRKERTGGLDESEIEKIVNAIKKWEDFEKQKIFILERIEELGVANAYLLTKIKECNDPKVLEDLYLPYKQKRKTRATVAIGLGLEPLAKIIMAQKSNDVSVQAARFTKRDLDIDAAIQGARDIIAEWISESVASRDIVRNIFEKSASLKTKATDKQDDNTQLYRDYVTFEKRINRLASHQLLAIFRAEKEGYLKVIFDIDQDYALSRLKRVFLKSEGEAAEHILLAAKDSLKRLILPSIETEIRADLKSKADDEAIQIFSKNVTQLLLEAPLGNQSILAIDPGFRTGCKVVCLDNNGDLLHTVTIFPLEPHNQKNDAWRKVEQWLKQFNIEAIAIGNGTGGREAHQWITQNLKKASNIQTFLLSEAGASIYSASEIAREEFPDIDVTYRGAISIGRRLMDPMAELVKIDPKSIGVGQYQHDVNQTKLKESLENVVMFAVNKVGVNVNTASKHLLQYVAGVGPKLAAQIVQERTTKGRYEFREELLNVKGFGKKSFQQAAGFLRVKDGAMPLDASAVHPERYDLVNIIAKDLQVDLSQLIGNETIINSIIPEKYVHDDVGLPTILDIIQELKRPGLDPRGAAEVVQFDVRLKSFEDVKVGMFVYGKINNLTKFGAFVDIGIKENGLIHISEISYDRIQDPSEKLSIGQQVTARVIDIDTERKRIGLSLKN